VHQHLGHVGAVRLVLGLFEDHLHGADHALGVLGHQQHAFASRRAVADAAPKGQRAFARQGLHEADGRAAVDAIDQEVGQPLGCGVVQHVDAAQCGVGIQGFTSRRRR
jgi:hypothetical protein